MKKFSVKLFLILGVVFAFSCIFFTSKADTNLLGRWSFNEHTYELAWDHSGNNNHGYPRGTLWGILGRTGLCLQFDHNDYVTMGDLESFDFKSTDSFSISAWVKIDDSISNYRVIVGKASNSSMDGYMLRHETDGNFSMNIEESDGQDQSNVIAYQDCRDNQWHHLVGVINRENKTNTIYLDGFAKGQADISKVGDLSNRYHFNIGSLENGGVSFKGLIDEVRIYNKALSLTEVRQLYNQDCQCSGIPYYQAGSLLRAANDYKVYYLNKNYQKKWIINEKVFNLYHNKWQDVIEVSSKDLALYPTVNLLRASNDQKVYLIQGETKQWIKSPQEFERKGFKWQDIDLILPRELAEYKEVD